jgi:hypothetical protein
MRTVLSIFLLVIFLLQSLIKVSILMDYQINQEFIATILCINKDQPKNTCKGQCYLSQQLEKAEDNENKELPSSSRQQLETHLFFDFYSSQIISVPVAEHKARPFGGEPDVYASNWLGDIFRPPEIQPIS